MSGLEYSTSYDTTGLAGTMGTTTVVLTSIFALISIILALLFLISLGKIFKKAGKPGWAAIVPIYNYIVMIEIAELPIWYIVLFFIPVANIVALIMINIKIAQNFGKSSAFGIGLSLLGIIFVPLLAFSDNVYKGDNTNNNQNNSFDAMNVINGNTNDATNTVSVENTIPTIENANIMVEGTNINTVSPSNDVVSNTVENTPVDTVVETNVMPEAPTIETATEDVQNVTDTNTLDNDVLEGNNSQEIEIDATPVNPEIPSVETNEVPNAFNMNVQSDTNTVNNSVEMPQAENVQVSSVQETNETPNAFNMNVQSDINTVNNSVEMPQAESIQTPLAQETNEAPNAFNMSASIETPNVDANNAQVENVPQNSSNTDTKICKSCGKEMPKIVSICPNCGTENE